MNRVDVISAILQSHRHERINSFEGADRPSSVVNENDNCHKGTQQTERSFNANGESRRAISITGRRGSTAYMFDQHSHDAVEHGPL